MNYLTLDFNPVTNLYLLFLDKHEDDAHLHVSPFDWPGNSCLHLIVTETLFVLSPYVLNWLARSLSQSLISDGVVNFFSRKKIYFETVKENETKNGRKKRIIVYLSLPVCCDDCSNASVSMSVRRFTNYGTPEANRWRRHRNTTSIGFSAGQILLCPRLFHTQLNFLGFDLVSVDF
jgi:hypothetical protein